MTNSRDNQADHLEDLIARVQELEEAGVFDRTPVDPAVLVSGGSDRKRPRRLGRLFTALQAAACLALAVGVISLWRSGDRPQSPVEGRSDGNGAVALPIGGAMIACITGPADRSLGEECRCFDSDADGDVDLADYGAFQRDYASTR